MSLPDDEVIPEMVPEVTPEVAKKKGGRPRLPPGMETTTTGVRFTGAELKELHERAEVLGVSMTAMIRHIVLNAPLPAARTKGEKPVKDGFRWTIREVVDGLMDIPVKNAEGRKELQRFIDKLLDI